jgi:hypothetical protein
MLRSNIGLALPQLFVSELEAMLAYAQEETACTLNNSTEQAQHVVHGCETLTTRYAKVVGA